MTRRAQRLAALAAACLLPGTPALAQEGSAHPNYLPLSHPGTSVPIAAVAVELTASSGDPARDAAAVAAVEAIVNGLAGRQFEAIEMANIVRRIEADPAVAGVAYRLLPDGANGARVRFDVTPAAPGAARPTFPAGFPTLLKTDRMLVTAIVAGGLGVYSDGNPWFGQPALFLASSPVAGHLPGSRATWTEGDLELGGGFAARLGDSNVYAFGAVTGMLSWSLGQDIFTNESRAYVAVEKGYAGILYANPATRNRVKLSLGRQTYTLNDGFLVNMVKGSSNAGPRGATYLGPRLTNDFSVLGEAHFGAWDFNAFYINPNELEQLESNSHFLGGNIAYTFRKGLSVDATVLTVPGSDISSATPQGRRVPLQGTTTVAGHLAVSNLLAAGVFTEAELAYQFNDGEDVAAWAGYGTLGFIARDTGWTPSLSYRYAAFSGDDPDTVTFERFTAPLSTGLGIWLQGIAFGKLFANTNLVTHRVQFNVAPAPALNVTFDYHRLIAAQLNNLGGNPALAQLASTDIGRELTLSGRWAIKRTLYLQGVASAAIPGEALQALGADRTWTTVQLSLYWSL